MRTFIAVEVPDEVKEKIGEYINKIRGVFGDKLKWVFPTNLHFTVKFLGEIKQSQLDLVNECVAETASGFNAFTIGLSGVGFFPSERKPRVFWIGADGGGDRLLDLFHDLESRLDIHGFDRDSKPFSPHLTIGRVRKYQKLVVPEKIEDFEHVSFEVNGLSIIKSTLTPRGPVYEKIFESSFD